MNKKAVITIGLIGGGLLLLRNRDAGAEGGAGYPESGGGGGGGFFDDLFGGGDDGTLPDNGVVDPPVTGGPDADGDGIQDAYDPAPNDPNIGPSLYADPGDPADPGTGAPGANGETPWELRDDDGDGVLNYNDLFPNDANRNGTEVASADAYPKSIWENPVVVAASVGLPALAITAPFVAKAYRSLVPPKLLNFAPEPIRAPRGAPRGTSLRAVPRGRVPAPSAPRALATSLRSGRATPLTPRALPRVATGPVRLTTLRVPGAPAGGLRVIPGAPVGRVAAVAPRIAAAMASPAAQTAGRVAARAATVATVVTGGYTAARNLYDTGQAASVLWNENRTQADIDRAKALSGGAVARGTEFLSLGLVSINPNSGTRILNQNFSYATGSNFVSGVKSIASGGRDNNRWTFWK